MATIATTPPRAQTRQATPTSTPKTPRPPGAYPIFKGRPGIKEQGEWDEDDGVWYVEIVWEDQNETWGRRRGPLQMWTLASGLPEPRPEANRPAVDPRAADEVPGTVDGPAAVPARAESEAVDASRNEPPTSGLDALSLDDTRQSDAPEGTGADDARASKDVDDVEIFSIPAEWSGLEQLTTDELRAQCQELGVSYELKSTINDDRTRKTLVERILVKVDIVAGFIQRLQSDDPKPLQPLPPNTPTTPNGALVSQVTRPREYQLADRISALSDEQRNRILPMLEGIVRYAEDESEKLRIASDLVRQNLEALKQERNENEDLRNEIEGLRNKLNDWRRVKGGKIPEGGCFMSRINYRKVLENAGLLERPLSGVAADGQDVYHIIATANGGPDHTDNYLYALGANFNRGISHNYDTFNLFMAGRAKAQKAVDVALRVAKDARLWDRIDQRRGCKQRTIFTESVHWDKFGSKNPNSSDDLADKMYNAGAGYLRFLRRVRRNQDLNDETLNNVNDMQRVLNQLGVENVSDDDLIRMLNDGDVGDES